MYLAVFGGVLESNKAKPVTTHTENALSNLTALLTRPSHQLQNLQKRIELLGGKVLLLPTIEIVDVEDQQGILEQLKTLKYQDIVIFISANAVHKTITIIRHTYPTWPLQVKIAAVGASTAEVLLGYGLNVTICPTQSFSSESLLALPALQNVTDKKIMLFRGEGGNPLLSRTLQARGAKVVEVAVYRRQIPRTFSNASILSTSMDVIVCTSATGLRNLVEMAGQEHRSDLLKTTLLVISQPMAEVAKILGFVKSPIIADNASDSSVVKALIAWWEKKHGK